jgi:hypothetical protein
MASLTEGLFTLEDIPVEAWQIITSYIDFTQLLPLIKASNKTIRHKLLKLGGINAIQVFKYDVNDNCHLDSDSHIPWLTSPDIVWLRTATYKSFAPLCYFPGLTSFYCTYGSETIFEKRLTLACLPPTLTHLAWHNRTLFEYHEGITLKNMFPNLLHCSLSGAMLPHLFSGLHKSLVSLRIDQCRRELFDELQDLPTNLTYLSLGRANLSVGDQQSELSVDQLKNLPLGITSLHLPSMRISRYYPSFAEVAPHLTDFTIHDIKLAVRQCLPRSLTKLTLIEDATASRNPYSEENLPDWPSNITSLSIHRMYGTHLPATRNITHLSIRGIGLVIRRVAPLRSSPFHLGQSLLSLKLPDCTFTEQELAGLPSSLKSLILQDVKMDGTSVPKGAKHLESLDQMKAYFWQSIRSFNLILRSPGAPSLNTGLPYLSLEGMVTFTLPGHSRVDFSDAYGTLTSLAHVDLLASSIPELPAFLTSLHYHAIPGSDKPIPLETFIGALPHLTHLSSHSPIGSPGLRGQISLGPDFFPKNRHTILQASSDPNTALSSSSPDLSVLRLPEDAIDLITNKNGQKIEFDGIEWIPLHLCDEQTHFPVQEATFTGSYSFGYALFLNAFPTGLTVLDITRAKFYDITIPGWISKTPVLPNTLTDLRLGGPYAHSILAPRSSDPTVELPSSLTRLSVEFERTPVVWKFSQPWPRNFATLEIRLIAEPPPHPSITALARFIFNSVVEDGPTELASRITASNPKPFSHSAFESFTAAFPYPEEALEGVQ